MSNQTRQFTLLLILASLGAALILYRLGSSGRRVRNRNRPESGTLPPVAGDGDDEWAGELGRKVWDRRVVAVGDLHGDLANAEKVLRMAGMIDASSRWIADQDHLVQTGDIVDRGTDTIELYRLFQRLRGEARAVGGEVVSILGNHEIMNAIGDWRYVTKPDIVTFGSSEERREVISEDGWIGQEWLANYSVVAKVPLSPYATSSTGSDQYLSFSHGSLNPSLPFLTPFPSAPNLIGHSLLRKSLTHPLAPPYPPAAYTGLPQSCTPDERQLYGETGVVWWRGLALESEETVCAWSQELRERLGVRRIIGGHTPNFEQIVSRCNASIIIIDTGISKAYGGVLSALEITYSLHEVVVGRGHDEMFGPPDVDRAATQSAILQTAQANAEDSEPSGHIAAGSIQSASRDSGAKKTYDEIEVVRAIYENGKVVLDRRKARVTLD